MRNLLKKHWPLVFNFVLLYAAAAFFLLKSVAGQDGHIVYALDDPYIHMALAKNVVKHQVWGVTAHEFTSATSSPLWVLILVAIYGTFGVSHIAPLILNVALATAMLTIIYVLLRRSGAQPLYISLALLAFTFLMPLPYFIFIGHEHILHTIITIALVFLASQAMSSDSRISRTSLINLGVLAFLLPMARYEGVFLIVAVSVLFLLRKRWQLALATAVPAALSVALYGIISVIHNGFWLPTSLIMKTDLGPQVGLKQLIERSISPYHLKSSYYNMFHAYYIHITMLIIIALALFLVRLRRGRPLWDKSQIILVIFIITGLMQVWWVRTGSWWRYDGYLVVLGLLAIVNAASDYFPTNLKLKVTPNLLAQTAAILLLVFLLGFGAMYRGFDELYDLPSSMRNIYSQQYQMALFIQTSYNHEGVVLNDIGAVSFLTDVRLVDVWALGSPEVAHAMRDGTYDYRFVERLALEKKCKIAIVYDQLLWRAGGIPQSWVKVGQWTISHNTTVAFPTVSIYAIEESEVERLIAELQQFAPRLPDDVRQTGLYVDQLSTTE